MIFVLSLLAAAAAVWYVSEVAAEAMTGTIECGPAAPASKGAYHAGERGSRPEGTGQLPRPRTIGSGILNSDITSEGCAQGHWPLIRQRPGFRDPPEWTSVNPLGHL